MISVATKCVQEEKGPGRNNLIEQKLLMRSISEEKNTLKVPGDIRSVTTHVARVTSIDRAEKLVHNLCLSVLVSLLLAFNCL